MPCTNPMKAWVSGKTENGKDNYHFTRPQGVAYDSHQLLPCGKCLSCQIDKSKEWATRGFHESQTHTENSFITLTYDEEHLPKHSTLVKKDLTNFIKLLRYYINKGRTKDDPDWIETKYLAAGEYGSKQNSHRPHYHICLFGYEPRDKQFFFSNKWGDSVYTSETISKIWKNKGYITISPLTYRTVAYTARYTVKKIVTKEDRQQDDYWIDKETGETNYNPVAYKKGLLMKNKIPEFITMSQGIGKNWHKKFAKDTHKDYITVNYGKHKVPRYYDKLMEKEDPQRLQAIKNKRILAAIQNEKTPQKLKQEATIKRNHVKQLNRNL